MFRGARKLMIFLLGYLPAIFGSGHIHAQEPARAAPVFTVDGKIALASLVALTDGYLTKLADSLQLLAESPEVKSGDWQKIRGPLGRAAQMNVPSLNWFSLPDGSYWSVQEGKAAGNLSTRPYFPKVLEGKTVIGDLVVSRATGKSTAIVAVPVIGRDKTVVGILGSSVYLDQLSARLEREMALDENHMIFYSFDSQPLTGLDWDPGLIFVDPTSLLGQEDLSRAVKEMMVNGQGTMSYIFRGRKRTVLYRKSEATGWWYVFGIVPETREAKGPIEKRRD